MLDGQTKLLLKYDPLLFSVQKFAWEELFEGENGMLKEQSYGLWERERVGRFERMELKHVKYHV